MDDDHIFNSYDNIDDTQQANRWLVQASGAARGVLVGFFRLVTRPAQMKVIVWLAKRKWKEAKAGDKAPVIKAPHIGPLLVEGLIGAAMYDVYGKTLGLIEHNGSVPYTGQYSMYADAFVSGGVAGAFCTSLNVPHNNLLKISADTSAEVRKAYQDHRFTLTGKNNIFRGLKTALPRDAFSTGVLFATNTCFKRNLPLPENASFGAGVLHAFVSGGLAGMCSTLGAVPFLRASEWTSQYSGTHYFKIARKLATRDRASFMKYVFAGLPLVSVAAFLPNAIGMSVMHVAAELNTIVENPDLDDDWATKNDATSA
eukprot:TRINITY_DN57737_c0_g1_i1.p1 TRINITY_DN57737_c0_g1~~TRINITY_DN57737_c0_g1_i1.p1  ORF type:complete len:329 (+),score=62.77 TRINITY_DN57737_c0_g1_i1:50-988(+)